MWTWSLGIFLVLHGVTHAFWPSWPHQILAARRLAHPSTRPPTERIRTMFGVLTTTFVALHGLVHSWFVTLAQNWVAFRPVVARSR